MGLGAIADEDLPKVTPIVAAPIGDDSKRSEVGEIWPQFFQGTHGVGIEIDWAVSNNTGREGDIHRVTCIVDRHNFFLHYYYY